jgi:hypothetical protein
MRRTVAVFVLAALVVAALGAGYVAVNPGRQRSTSTSSVEEPTGTTTISTMSSSGLELSVGLNATMMVPGQTLAANVTLYDALKSSLSLQLAPGDFGGGSISSWENYDFICGNGGDASYLVGFAVLQGRFSAGNLSQAPAPLQVAAQADLPCLYPVFSHGETITFFPGSDIASIPGTGLSQEPVALNVTTYACIALPSNSAECHSGTGLYGYWSTSESICCPASSDAADLFRYLTPGDYTIVAEDVWDQEVFAYFQVVPAPSPAEAVSAQESPFSAINSPIVGLTLANFGSLPIISLNATLAFEPPPENPGGIPIPYPFTFAVNSSAPLEPGQAIQETRTLNGSLFELGVNYPLAVSGTLVNGTEFSYTQQIQLVNLVPSS